jgi:hypothetical protein
MDLLMVLVELRRQDECSLAKQVNLFPFHLDSMLSKCIQCFFVQHQLPLYRWNQSP